MASTGQIKMKKIHFKTNFPVVFIMYVCTFGTDILKVLPTPDVVQHPQDNFKSIIWLKLRAFKRSSMCQPKGAAGTDWRFLFFFKFILCFLQANLNIPDGRKKIEIRIIFNSFQSPFSTFFVQFPIKQQTQIL